MQVCPGKSLGENSHFKILIVGAERRDCKPRSLHKGQVGLDVEGRMRAQIWGLLGDLFPIELVPRSSFLQCLLPALRSPLIPSFLPTFFPSLLPSFLLLLFFFSSFPTPEKEQ